jgi:hypothetical protein
MSMPRENLSRDLSFRALLSEQLGSHEESAAHAVQRTGSAPAGRFAAGDGDRRSAVVQPPIPERRTCAGPRAVGEREGEGEWRMLHGETRASGDARRLGNSQRDV